MEYVLPSRAYSNAISTPIMVDFIDVSHYLYCMFVVLFQVALQFQRKLSTFAGILFRLIDILGQAVSP